MWHRLFYQAPLKDPGDLDTLVAEATAVAVVATALGLATLVLVFVH